MSRERFLSLKGVTGPFEFAKVRSDTPVTFTDASLCRESKRERSRDGKGSRGEEWESKGADGGSANTLRTGSALWAFTYDQQSSVVD